MLHYETINYVNVMSVIFVNEIFEILWTLWIFCIIKKTNWKLMRIKRVP